ncbi:unnamed protein product (macronuclear) [Paramecium tetraurelia]|uniref:t-SNARE coiled-coil homology domain-containing protein n=1 Tax=Paramecium tetraurelia TaxID=5888 RepID=A0EDZ2_PARTE|nr:uncharacterized protein GSPATT00025853001 [Paramecium tetraurelia]CAK93509.1 unnamed protein product [Paramecium tetraurelia]|eukprot:XP_001460906.1 hypothetical protein (macronuclear) [Paramecium tetraurelia strain d4-2]
MSFQDQAEKIFGGLQKAFKRLELELEYNYEIILSKQKAYQESLGMIAELEQLVMIRNTEIEIGGFQEMSQSVSLDDQDHHLLMTQLKDNINLVNDYKQQIQEIRRQNQLINKLVKEQSHVNSQNQSFEYDQENEHEINSNFIQKRQQKNVERVKEIEKKIKEKQKNLCKMQKKIKGKEKDYDYRLLNQIERLDSDIEKITHQIKSLID